jgi:DNA-3-methyladenine glycosylase II
MHRQVFPCSRASREQLSACFRHTFEAMRDFSPALQHLAKVDKPLAKVIRLAGPCGLPEPKRFSTYDALVTSVIHQQLNGTAAKRIEARVREAFATPEALTKARMPALRAVGLSANKALSLKALALAHGDSTLADAKKLKSMSDDEAVDTLTEYRGIGPWTVHMLLMFRLGREDVLPVGDFGVKAGFTKLYRLPSMVTASALTKHAEAWRPYRSIASWYLWRVNELTEFGGKPR